MGWFGKAAKSSASQPGMTEDAVRKIIAKEFQRRDDRDEAKCAIEEIKARGWRLDHPFLQPWDSTVAVIWKGDVELARASDADGNRALITAFREAKRVAALAEKLTAPDATPTEEAKP